MGSLDNYRGFPWVIALGTHMETHGNLCRQGFPRQRPREPTWEPVGVDTDSRGFPWAIITGWNGFVGIRLTIAWDPIRFLNVIAMGSVKRTHGNALGITNGTDGNPLKTVASAVGIATETHGDPWQLTWASTGCLRQPVSSAMATRANWTFDTFLMNELNVERAIFLIANDREPYHGKTAKYILQQ